MVETSSSDRFINLWFKRHHKGIRVRVQVIPEIEDFFRQWGGGHKGSPTHGRLWKTLKQDDPPLHFWSFEYPLNHQQPFDIYATGSMLETNGLTNISFLRAVDASKGDGREFIVEMVVSNKELRDMSQRIIQMAERFYLEYIRPTNLNVYIGSLDASRIAPAQLGVRSDAT